MKNLNRILLFFGAINLGFGLSGCFDPEEILSEAERDDAAFLQQDFVPGDAPGLMMWLDSSDGKTLFVDDTCSTTPAANEGDLVGCWADKSGNNFNAVQMDTAKKPELHKAVRNSLSGLYFPDTAEQNLVLPSSSWQSNSEFSAYIVYFQDASDGLSSIFATFPDAGEDFAITSRPLTGSTKNKYLDVSTWKYASTNTAGDWNIDAFNRSGTRMSYYLDGSLDGQFNNLRNASEGVAHIGSYTNSTSSFKGNIVEIIWYSNELSVQDRQRVEGYLARKWALKFQLPEDHPYRENTPSTEVQVGL